MSAHGIDIFNFEFWRSGPPQLVHEQVVTHTRPGADGIGQTKLGQWGRPFSAELDADFATYGEAMAVYGLLTQIVGTGPVPLKYNQINYMNTFGHLYLVDGVQLIRCKRMNRLIGPGYDFIGGSRLTVSIQLTPFRP